MKTILAFVIMSFCCSVYAQDYKESSLKYTESSSGETTESNPPLEFGIDAGYNLGGGMEKFAMLSTNVKLTKNKFFLRIEYGQIFDKNFSMQEYASVGFDHRVVNSKKNKLDYNVGIAGGVNDGETGVGAVMGLRYMYSLSEKFGITSSLRLFPNTNEIPPPFFSLGLQLE